MVYFKFDVYIGEMIFFGYFVKGLGLNVICYNVVDKDGNLMKNLFIEVLYLVMVYDFFVIEIYVIFFIFFLIIDLEWVFKGEVMMVWEFDKGIYFGVLFCDGLEEDIWWFNCEVKFMFYMMNVWIDGLKFYVDVIGFNVM